MRLEYYRHHAVCAEDFSIRFENLDVQERGSVAWFYTRQQWRLKWSGVRERISNAHDRGARKGGRALAVCSDSRIDRCNRRLICYSCISGIFQ